MENINGKLVIALSRALRYTHRDSEELMRSYHLTMGQFQVLEALYHKGDCSIHTLTQAVLSTSGNMTVVIRNLEQAGYIIRDQNPEDRRSFLIRLTKAGQKLIGEVFTKHMVLLDKRLSKLSEAEKETIIEILKKLK